MVLKSYLVGPVKEGQQDDVEPFFLPEDAYEKLEDAYVFRGKIKKRFGYDLIGSNDLYSRLRVKLGVTDESGNFNTGSPTNKVPGVIFKIGQMFSIGDEIFTVNVLGEPADMLKTGTSTLATFDTTTGQEIFQGSSANTSVFFYPSEPVMGIRLRESDIKESVIAFDTQFSYERDASGWRRLGDALWSGDNSKFFWSTNYKGANSYETVFYVSNFNSDDKIKHILSGDPLANWITLRPRLNKIGTGDERFLETCRIILPFKDRLVCLNTVESITETKHDFFNRCRFSQSGDPTNNDNSWLDTIPGRGGFIDAPTKEKIVTAQRLKDKLIVYFERSTWELIYTASVVLPFKWQKINSELGCESPFASVVFDESILGVGNVGIHGCNGTSVKRIDEKIPDEVFKIHNGNDGPNRVHGIRDFYNECVYWAFPNHLISPTFPNKIILYNYRNNTWAFFNDSFTCFGNYQKIEDITWKNNGNTTWKEINNSWNSSLFQSSFPDIIAGNQQGFVFVLNNERSSNSQSLYVTDIDKDEQAFTVFNHNLKVGDYLVMEEAQGSTSLNGKVFKVEIAYGKDTFKIDLEFEKEDGEYTGGGKLSRISNMKILTKSFNPGTQVGKRFRMPFIDFLLNKTTSGEVSLDYFLDTNVGDSSSKKAENKVLLGNNILYTKPEDMKKSQVEQKQIWHRYYLQAQSQFLQLLFFMSDDQMRDLNISQSDFELHAMIFYVEGRGDLIR